MDSQTVKNFIDNYWGSSIIPGLAEFIRIPAKSPSYDADWEVNRNLESAATFLASWAEAQNIPGLTAEVLRLKGRTPLLYIEIPGYSKDTVLFYAHLDKMPEADGWDEDLGPWKAVLKNNRLYGRGSVDDGYALFSFIGAIKFLETYKIPHARAVLIIEASEESGSYDLEAYLQSLHKRIGQPNLINCLDVGCGDYERLWCATSLRGVVEGTLKVDMLERSVHSGIASGIVASSFRVLRMLLDRIEDSSNGKVLLKSCSVNIPNEVKQQAKTLAEFLGPKVYSHYPLLKGVEPVSEHIDELILNKTWRSTLSVIGAEGLPQVKDSATVLRPSTTLQISLRIPPGAKGKEVWDELAQVLTAKPPYGAKVSFTSPTIMTGWHAPHMHAWLQDTLQQASENYFGNAPMYYGEGGSIGVITMLQEQYPQAQFVLSGAAGPNSGEHGPNESLYLPAAKKLTCCLVEMLAAHGARHGTKNI